MAQYRKHLTICIAVALLCCMSSNEDPESVKVKEGTTATLNTRKDGCDSSQQVVWMFGPNGAFKRIARVRDGEAKTDFSKHFGGRLQLDRQSGALNISQVGLNDSGVYRCQSIGSSVFTQQFNLTVYASIYAPSIRMNSSGADGSCSSLTVECSVQGGQELRLSWFRGEDKVKETSHPDVSPMLRLSLLIRQGEEDKYTCVAENPVDRKSSSVHTKDTCLSDGETSGWCHTEVMARLVASAVLGLVLMVLVVDHVRFRRQTKTPERLRVYSSNRGRERRKI